MARATTVTLIPIDKVSYHLQIDPYHFNSIQTDLHPITPACSDDWYQHDWQAGGKLSRESIALALKAAENFTYQYLGWTPLPIWHEEEDVIFPQHYRTEVYNIFRNSQGSRKSVKTKWGYVIEAGYKDTTFIDTPATAFSDEDLDGYEETVTISFATTVTEPQELHVFFEGKEGHPSWEIKPLDSIEIAGGVATITFPKYLIPLPHLWEQMKSITYPALAIDGDDDTKFETAVDVYRVFTNPSLQIQFISDSGTATGELHVKREREGFFSYRIATWDDVEEEYASACFNYIPVRGRIWYKAGFRDMDKDYPDLQMREDLERLIVYYALSKVDTELCGCSNTRNIWEHQSTDLARQGEGVSYVMPWDQLGNPFGTTRAAFNLWNWAKQFKLSGSPYAK